jgi:hypothetical protein
MEQALHFSWRPIMILKAAPVDIDPFDWQALNLKVIDYYLFG